MSTTIRALAKPSKVLVVHHDQMESARIIDTLDELGSITDYASNYLTALHLLSEQAFDFIIISDSLSGGSGEKLVAQIRQHVSKTITIFFCSKQELEPEKRVELYYLGVDDIWHSQMPIEEKLAKLNAAARRMHTEDNTVLKFGPLMVDVKNRQVTREGKEVKLTQTGFQILTRLLKNSPNVVAKQELEWDLWQDQPPNTDVLRSHMYHLRRQLDKPFEFPLIHTIHGHGFRLQAQAQTQAH
ncbi:response regulator transcription factor [Pseudoalteromonas sp. T1lg65]|uniref:response regulator transcription factor n=1 Tax=Pseudoalteromonas sp. T1lg65 TaxID=2077101 RepID=UPI003F7994BF